MTAHKPRIPIELQSLMLCFAIVAGPFISMVVSNHHKSQDLKNAFAVAYVSDAERPIIETVLFQRGGECNLLEEKLHQKCEAVKETANIRYEHVPISYGPR